MWHVQPHKSLQNGATEQKKSKRNDLLANYMKSTLEKKKELSTDEIGVGISARNMLHKGKQY